MKGKKELKGIGGWLLLPTLEFFYFGFVYLGLGLIFLDSLYSDFLNLFSLQYGLSSMFIVIMIFFYSYTLILEFRHKKEFIKVAIFTLWLRIPMIFYMDIVFGFQRTLWHFIENYALPSIPLIILTLYLKKSKRVKNTFVK